VEALEVGYSGAPRREDSACRSGWLGRRISRGPAEGTDRGYQAGFVGGRPTEGKLSGIADLNWPGCPFDTGSTALMRRRHESASSPGTDYSFYWFTSR
jgi:hypothetical protein